MIKNPILRGFNPDPSIIRVGDDYYIATSTFEWFPGVQIHHSKDLKHWEVIAQPLNRLSQLEMRGLPDSCGVWAPCLTYKDGIFYLVYTNVKSFDGVWKDTPNYLVTTEDIRGEWSDPVYISSRGFDGSLFHDTGGKSYYLNMLMDHRKEQFFGGIELQEFDLKAKQLVGTIHYLTPGTDLGCTEGPHLVKKDDYYYLILAEGGTEYGHAETVMRSKTITGPYELHPNNPLVTCKHHPEHQLQKSGHGDFVEAEDGRWFFVFLTGRPLSIHGKCILGRETSIEELEWKEGWPYLKSGTQLPRTEIQDLGFTEGKSDSNTILYNFDSDSLSMDFQSLRVPQQKSWISLNDRKGYLRLYGKESLNSLNHQALVARRIQHFHIEASTLIDFKPGSFLEMAGLVFYYNTAHYHYLHLSANYEGTQKLLKVISMDHYKQSEQEEEIDVSDFEAIVLKGVLNHKMIQFYYSTDDGKTFQKIGNELDATILSDDHVQAGDERYRPAFTGSFVGLCCQDLAFNKKHADFNWFHYKEIH